MECVGRVDQRLGGDAADIEAGTAELFRLDDDRINTQLPSSDGADIATGSCTDYQQPAGDIFHSSAFHEDQRGRFEQRLDALDESGGIVAVHHAVIEA
jgi:hypothetical protein